MRFSWAIWSRMNWIKLLALWKREGNILFIDLPEYYIERVGKILGILLTMVGHPLGASASTV